MPEICLPVSEGRAVRTPQLHFINPLMSEFLRENRVNWIALQKEVFGDSAPDTQTWTHLDDIVRFLSRFSKRDQSHVFLPSGGGIDLTGVRAAYEPDCIELLDGSSIAMAHVVRPARLLFESIFECPGESYFRLETFALAPRVAPQDVPLVSEEAVGLPSGQYLPASAWNDQSYKDRDGRDRPLPSSARLCFRWFSGTFVIFAKGSMYNLMNATYDGRHNKMTAPEFRGSIERLVAQAKAQRIPG